MSPGQEIQEIMEESACVISPSPDNSNLSPVCISSNKDASYFVTTLASRYQAHWKNHLLPLTHKLDSFKDYTRCFAFHRMQR